MRVFKRKYTDRNDEQLLVLLTKGQKGAFRELYERYHVRMFRFFYRMLQSNEDRANDFTQDLFLKIVEHPGAFDPERKFSSWIYAVAHNMVKNEYRRKSRAPKLVEIPENESILKNDGAFPDRIDREVRRKELAKAIQKLSPKHRTCFVLRYYEGLEIKAISEIIDCPEGTVKSRLYYAIKELSDLLSAYAFVHDR